MWRPSEEVIAQANLSTFMKWLREHRGYQFESYQALWRWSVSKIEEFWASLWDYFDIIASRQPEIVLAERVMPGTVWFPGARLNYAENLLRHANSGRTAIYFRPEAGPLERISWDQLAGQAAALAAAFRDLGVSPGDRVVAYLPNIPQAISALLAAASLGAVWSSCPPDFGERSVLDRFSQIDPKVLIAVDGYIWGGRSFNRTEVVNRLQENLPSLERTIVIDQIGASEKIAGESWEALLSQYEGAAFAFEQLPFSHPLWVLYSSGTTGLPKPIVQSQGGILLEHLKSIHLTMDLKKDDRFFWYTSTGWMMWNYLVGGLLNGTPIVLYDGSPNFPDLNVLWALAAEAGMTYFGTGAAFILACMKADLHPGRDFDLSSLRALGSTGSPLPAEGFGWVYERVHTELALESFSGGTDLCTGFIGGIRTQPIYAGELQGPSLGANVQAFNESGMPVLDEIGELVITEPMTSMPLYFWNDPGMVRYRQSYFEMYPDVWRHGDWIEINARNGCVIYGRSDSTINRQGIRMGTSEIYRVVESHPEIADSLVVDLELLGRKSFMPLFVLLREGAALDERLKDSIKANVRSQISPRHVPDEIIAVEDIPYTLSGKKMEVPIRRILLGHPLEKAVNQGAMRNPESLEFYIEFARWIEDNKDAA